MYSYFKDILGIDAALLYNMLPRTVFSLIIGTLCEHYLKVKEKNPSFGEVA